MSDVDHVISINFHTLKKKGEMRVGYIVSKDSESFDEAFLGETDNFGHWIFEVFTKVTLV